MVELLDFWRSGFYVKRFHTENVIKEDTVGHHSANVAALVFWLYRPNRPSIELVEAALLHDVAEYETGDVPAHAKWKSKDLKAILDFAEGQAWEAHNEMPPDKILSTDDYHALKFCDSIDLAIKVVHEMSMGNRTVKHVFRRLLPGLRGGIHLLDSRLQYRAEHLLNVTEERFKYEC